MTIKIIWFFNPLSTISAKNTFLFWGSHRRSWDLVPALGDFDYVNFFFMLIVWSFLKLPTFHPECSWSYPWGSTEGSSSSATLLAPVKLKLVIRKPMYLLFPKHIPQILHPFPLSHVSTSTLYTVVHAIVGLEEKWPEWTPRFQKAEEDHLVPHPIIYTGYSLPISVASYHFIFQGNFLRSWLIQSLFSTYKPFIFLLVLSDIFLIPHCSGYLFFNRDGKFYIYLCYISSCEIWFIISVCQDLIELVP